MVSEHSWTPSARPSPIPTPDIELQKLDPGILLILEQTLTSFAMPSTLSSATRSSQASLPPLTLPFRGRNTLRIVSLSIICFREKSLIQSLVVERHSDEIDTDVGGNHSTLQVPIHRRAHSGRGSENWFETPEPREGALARFAAQQPDPFHAITGRCKLAKESFLGQCFVELISFVPSRPQIQRTL